jgi:hypothetical protein
MSKNYVAEAKAAWSRALPWTAMSTLASSGADSAERRRILRSWGVSEDDAIDFASDTYLSLAGEDIDGLRLLAGGEENPYEA